MIVLSPGALLVGLSIREKRSAPDASWEVKSEQKAIRVEPGSLVDMSLPLPPSSLSLQSSFRLYLDGEDESSGVRFYRYADLHVSPKNSSLFVQTDKGIYKPGDTVRFRAIHVDEDLVPVAAPINAHVTDADGNRIQHWLNDDGVGEWCACV